MNKKYYLVFNTRTRWECGEEVNYETRFRVDEQTYHLYLQYIHAKNSGQKPSSHTINIYKETANGFYEYILNLDKVIYAYSIVSK